MQYEFLTTRIMGYNHAWMGERRRKANEVRTAEAWMVLREQVYGKKENDMNDIYAQYEDGLEKLLSRIGRDHPRYMEVLTLLARLQENINRAQRYGDSENIRTDRSYVIARLNVIALEELGITFSELSFAHGDKTDASKSQGFINRPTGPVKQQFPTRIFLSYAKEDEQQVKEIYQRLADAGFAPWMESEDYLPGERREEAIKRAINRSDFILVCVSGHTASGKSLLQREHSEILENWRKHRDRDIYLIPVRLEACELPEIFAHIESVDLFDNGTLNENEWNRLVKAIRVEMERVQKKQASSKKPPPFVSGGAESSSASSGKAWLLAFAFGLMFAGTLTLVLAIFLPSFGMGVYAGVLYLFAMFILWRVSKM